MKMTGWIRVIAACFALFASLALATASPIILVPANAVWKYLDDGSNQGTGWTAVSFDDSAWLSGPAQLGYGDGDEATVIGFCPNAMNRYITTYFRRTVVAP